MAAVRKRHAEHRLTGLQERHEDRHVRLCAGVRLHVCMLGAEELTAAIERERFSNVDPFAPAVVALSGISLGVLVGHHAAHRFANRPACVVLRRDQLEILSLAPLFAGDGGKDLGVLRLDGGAR